MFCADLARMYERYARRRGFACETVEERGDGRGARQLVLRLHGKGVHVLLGESGGHSIQHKTRSRKADRIHTSTVTVAAFDAAELAQAGAVMLSSGEVRVDTFRGSGAGGQHRNTRDTAIRAVHIPTGETATVTSGRKQQENRERALEVLAARVQARREREGGERVERRRRAQTRAERARAGRVYDLVRDMVRCEKSGRKVKRVKRVLDGDLDLLLA